MTWKNRNNMFFLNLNKANITNSARPDRTEGKLISLLLKQR